MVDLIIRNARLLGGESVSIVITDGRIVHVGPLGAAAEGPELDAGDRLALPSFVNAHLHVDKALTVGSSTAWQEGTFQESINMTLDSRREYTRESLLERGRRVLQACVETGTGTIRAFADVGTVGGTLGAEVLIELRDELRDCSTSRSSRSPGGLRRDPGPPASMCRP